MNRLSTESLEFKTTVSNWIIDKGEVLALYRYPNSAGNRDFELITNTIDFQSIISELIVGTSVIIIKEYELPIRGKVSDSLIQKAKHYFKKGKEYIIIETKIRDYGYIEDIIELEEELNELIGTEIIYGKFPEWDENKTLIEAYKPDNNGKIIRASY